MSQGVVKFPLIPVSGKPNTVTYFFYNENNEPIYMQQVTIPLLVAYVYDILICNNIPQIEKIWTHVIALAPNSIPLLYSNSEVTNVH